VFWEKRFRFAIPIGQEYAGHCRNHRADGAHDHFLIGNAWRKALFTRFCGSGIADQPVDDEKLAGWLRMSLRRRRLRNLTGRVSSALTPACASAASVARRQRGN